MTVQFREEIIDHYKNPRNFGELKNKTHLGKGINAACGDMIEMALEVKEGKIREVKWRGVGCAMMSASASLLSEEIMGKKIDEVKQYNEKTIENLMGEINPGRIKCVLLPLSALKQAMV